MSISLQRTHHSRLMAVLIFGCLLAPAFAPAVILYRTADPNANTTAPSNDPAASGWNYEGGWGGFLGTPIAPHFFISARHIGQAGGDFVYGGVHYTIVSGFADPFSDLQIWQVVQTFPSFAPLYTNMDEVGQRLVVIGCGTQRGSEFYLGGELRGWNWGGGGPKRWGENVVSEIVNFSGGPDDAIYSTFDQNGLPDESHLSTGDSGGAVFIEENGVWKLAGINYSVDGYFYTDNMGGGEFVAALFDMRDLYYRASENPPAYVQITGAAPIPSGFYATRISSKMAWIYSVIDPAGDLNNDGRSNLLDYARVLNAAPLPGYGEPKVARESGFLSMTYRRIANAASLQYQVQKSSDLTSWEDITPQEEVVRTDLNVQTINAKVAVGPNTRLFVRLKITQAASRPGATSSRDVYKTRSAR